MASFQNKNRKIANLAFTSSLNKYFIIFDQIIRYQVMTKQESEGADNVLYIPITLRTKTESAVANT